MPICGRIHWIGRPLILCPLNELLLDVEMIRIRMIASPCDRSLASEILPKAFQHPFTRHFQVQCMEQAHVFRHGRGVGLSQGSNTTVSDSSLWSSIACNSSTFLDTHTHKHTLDHKEPVVGPSGAVLSITQMANILQIPTILPSFAGPRSPSAQELQVESRIKAFPLCFSTSGCVVKHG